MNALVQPTLAIQNLIHRLCELVPQGASLQLDSRHIRAADVFLACPGLSGDGRDYIADAISHGAAAIVCEQGLSESQRQALGNVPVFEIQDLRQHLGMIAHLWWQRPSESVGVVAVTGTNGKTSISQWLGAALRLGGQPCGVIGTLGVVSPRGELLDDVGLTTPDVVSMHRLIARLRDEGAKYVVLEASSIGLDQARLDAIAIQAALFSNLTQDHLDYHADMQAYAQAKARLFKVAGLKFAIVNNDDPSAGLMVHECAADVVRFGIRPDAGLAYSAVNVRSVREGAEFSIAGPDGQIAVSTPFIGQHNVSNLTAVAAALGCLGWSLERIAEVLPALPPVPGRLEPVVLPGAPADRPRVFVDYAHTPDALRQLLVSVRDLADARNGRIWCVAGCGGDRDPGKRAPMGQVLSQCADRFIVTSDNPRSEDPQTIIARIWSGVSDPDRGECERDREVAILKAIWQARANDVVVIAGKGHEAWQYIGKERRAFDDREWAKLGLLLYGGEQWQALASVVTDSRAVRPGDLFVAIQGERFDAHQFVSDVARQGACAALVCQRCEQAGHLLQIQVDDTRRALRAMARAWRERFVLPVIAVTGSNGKTTTKEMLAAILRHWVGDHHTLATQGNLNNDLGVPLTLLRLRPWHKAAVVELGMNHPGEISMLARLAAPTVGLVLNAQREHQEFMHSVEAVAQENGCVLEILDDTATAVFPDQPPHTALWKQQGHQARCWQFGLDRNLDIHVRDLKTDVLGSAFTLCTPVGEHAVKLPVPGLHNVFNAMASAGCALAAGASLEDVVAALEQFEPVKGRMQTHRLEGDRILIDDTYNANPDSVRAAIDVLAALEAPRALVLGDMGEVGAQGPQMHAEVGSYARSRRVDFLWTLGSATRESVKAFGDGSLAFDGVDALVAHAARVMPRSLLVKGSRFMSMERIVQALLAHEATDNNKNTGGQHHAG